MAIYCPIFPLLMCIWGSFSNQSSRPFVQRQLPCHIIFVMREPCDTSLLRGTERGGMGDIIIEGGHSVEIWYQSSLRGDRVCEDWSDLKLVTEKVVCVQGSLYL